MFSNDITTCVSYKTTQHTVQVHANSLYCKHYIFFILTLKKFQCEKKTQIFTKQIYRLHCYTSDFSSRLNSGRSVRIAIIGWPDIND